MGSSCRPLNKAKKGYGFNDEAIDFANGQLKRFEVGDFIRYTERDDDGWTRGVHVFRILRIKLGEYTKGLFGFSLVCEPSMIVEDVITGQRKELCKYVPFFVEISEMAYRVFLRSYHSASVWPFAVTIGSELGHGYFASGDIKKMDKIEAKQYLENVIASRKREQERLELKKQEAIRRQKENDSISETDIDALIKKARTS